MTEQTPTDPTGQEPEPTTPAEEPEGRARPEPASKPEPEPGSVYSSSDEQDTGDDSPDDEEE